MDNDYKTFVDEWFAFIEQQFPLKCQHCGTCITAEHSGKCPECGFVFDPVWVN